MPASAADRKPAPPRGKLVAMKVLAVLLYALGSVSQGLVAKLLGVSHVAVHGRVRAAGNAAWHVVDGKGPGSALAGL